MKKIILLLMILGATVADRAQAFYITNDSYAGNWQQPDVLTKKQFATLLNSVRNAPFADDKRKAFISGIQRNYITVSQVSELLKLFAFDDDKLPWAKLAYRYTADAQKFYTLRDDFLFLTTQGEFDSFLKASDNNRYGHRNLAVMSRTEFTGLKNTISSSPFADDKKKAFRLAVQNNYITVAQLSELLKLFTFDDEKVDWALMAYHYTADTENFYQLRNTFTFISSKQKLDDFLSHTSK